MIFLVAQHGMNRSNQFILQFAASFFLLIDAATLSSHAKPPPDAPHDTIPVHMSFVDWIPAIFSTCQYHRISSFSRPLLTRRIFAQWDSLSPRC